MTTATQQLPSNPALDFAQSILDVTNNALDLIEILNEIAEDEEKAGTNDRITAANSLMDRVFGKRPKQLFPNPDPPPETDDNDVEALREAPTLRESPRANPTDGPESAEGERVACPERSRRVTQIDDSLNQSIGPAPRAHTTTRHSRESGNPLNVSPLESPDPFAPNSIHFTIQKHILAITNNGQTLRDTLLDIAKADDDPRITPYHRRRATIILIDRALGTDPTPVLRAVQERPEPGQSDSDYPDYPPGYVFDPTKDCIYCSQSLNMPEGHEGEHRFDHEGMAKALEEVERMLEEQGITRDPNPPKIDYPISMPSKEWVANNIDVIREETAKFQEEIKLRIERRKAWPAIEERRRKKLAQIYPSHSENDDEPPET